MKKNRNESLAWVEKQKNISINAKIKEFDNPVRGIYGIFYGDEEECAYVGRSLNIYSRMFKSYGHITQMMYGEHENKQLQNAVDTGQKIHINLLEEVEYIFDNYYKDMQKLASRENYYIDLYQQNNQCLGQVPEGTSMTKEDWESLKNKENN